MKKLLFILAATVFCFTTASAQEAKIKGQLKFTDPVQKVFLFYSHAGERVTDSTMVKDGKFVLNAKMDEPTLATLMVTFAEKDSGARRPERKQVFLEPGNINISVKDSMEFAKVSGSKSEVAFEKYNESLKPYDNRMEGFNTRFVKAQKEKDEKGMQSVRDDYQVMLKEKNEKVLKAYVQNQPNSAIALYVLGEYAGYSIDPAVIEPMFDHLSSANKNSTSGKAFAKRIATAKKTSVGALAMGFTQDDTLGKPVSLADFRGKYVLLDFWASWCGPCRAENPNVVKNFKEYHDNNFTVLSVSLDQPGKKKAWLDAIHHDGLTWTHVSDLKFWDNAVAKEYGVRAIPQNFLIDPSGKIIGKDLRGDDLSKELAKVLPK